MNPPSAAKESLFPCWGCRYKQPGESMLVANSSTGCSMGATTGRQDTFEPRVERRHRLLKQKPPKRDLGHLTLWVRVTSGCWSPLSLLCPCSSAALTHWPTSARLVNKEENCPRFLVHTGLLLFQRHQRCFRGRGRESIPGGLGSQPMLIALT